MKIKITQIDFDVTSDDDIDFDIDTECEVILTEFQTQLMGDFIGKIYEIQSEDEEDINDVADAISDESGFCIKSWDYEIVS